MTNFLSFDNQLLEEYKEVFKERGLPENIVLFYYFIYNSIEQSEDPLKYSSIKGVEYDETDSPSYYLVKNEYIYYIYF